MAEKAIANSAAEYLPSPLYRLSYHPHKVPNILFCGVERAHPAYDRFLFHPHIEEVVLLDFFYGVTGDLSEDAVGLDLPNNFDSWNAAHFLFQKASHAVGMFGAAPPEVIGEQGLELCGDESHLRRELHALLSQIEKVVAKFRLEKDNGFAAQDSVLCAAEREHIHAQIAGRLA